MTLLLDKEKKTAARKQIAPAAVLNVEEAIAVCPKCKAFQTVFFAGDTLMQTRKFSQKDGQIFHDCSPEQACRLYRGI